MDASGYPQGPESATVPVLLWGLLFVLLAASVVVTIVTARRAARPRPVWAIGAVVFVLGLVAALFMWLPAYVFSSPTGGGNCPIDAMSMAFMRGDRNSGFYAAWQPCRDASRRTLALALGGFAPLAGLGGLVQLRLARRQP